jgi:hypothetical protein
MIKLVIQTQYRENYSFDQDGNPVDDSSAVWKFKGGDTYVVPNFRLIGGVGDLAQYAKDTVEQLRPLIEYSNSASEEYILNWEIMDQNEKVCDPWKSPVELTDMGTIRGWIAIQVEDNRTDEDGYGGHMRSEILEKTSTYDLVFGGDRANYKASYLMKDGDIVDNDAGLRDWFGVQAA